jgi:hypothetical protein
MTAPVGCGGRWENDSPFCNIYAIALHKCAETVQGGDFERICPGNVGRIVIRGGWCFAGCGVILRAGILPTICGKILTSLV